MKKILLLISICGLWTTNYNAQEIKNAATFTGQQVTGVTVSDQGRIFANFPRWRQNVQYSVVEVLENGSSKAFPNKEWNSWNLGKTLSHDTFVAVQSVVAFENILYVLDTRNPLFSGVMGNPVIFAFDLESNELIRSYILSEQSFCGNSYINDLRIDKKNGEMYLTDLVRAGLVVIDLESGESFRVLDNHESTLAETDQLTFSNGVWKNTVHSDGIALDTKNDKLYYHALTGYNLYAVPTNVLTSGNEKEIQNHVILVAKTPAPDGMIIDDSGNLFLADLENQKIKKYTIPKKKLSVFAEGENIKWADTFSIHNNELYCTNSRINEASGDISDMDFSINKIKID
ncbi:MAG: L-dopachrome tautomerase-related protein [Bacteroidota bacterium]